MRPLREQELQLIELVSDGYSSKEIADLTHNSITTIDGMRGKLFLLFGVRNTAQLISYAYQRGILKIKS